jgi:hypothetical protein
MAEAALKPEKDYSKQVDELVPQAQKLAKVCHIYYDE